jgi:hypothetical protein
MSLEDLEGKRVFSQNSGAICGSFDCLEALARMNRGSWEVWEFFRDF